MKPSFFLVPLLAMFVLIATTPNASALPQTDRLLHYQFDETSGTTFADSGVNSIDATFYRPLKYDELPGIDVSSITQGGMFGPLGDPYIGLGTRAIDTGGGVYVDHQMMVDVPTSTNLPGAGDTFAVSFWLSLDDWTSSYGLIASYNYNGLQWSIGPHSSYDALVAWTGDADPSGTSYAWQADCSTLTPSTFAHFVVQFEGTAGITNVYVNGATTTDDGDANFWSNEREGFTLGGRVLDARPYTVPTQNPFLEDFAIINGIVDSTDISNLMTSGATSLGTRRLAHYTLNDTTGTQITDSSANANHGTLIGYDSTTMGLDVRDMSGASRPGVFGNSVELASAFGEHAELPTEMIDELPGDGEAFTVCFWMKPDENMADMYGWDQAGVVFSWSNNVEGLGFSVAQNYQSLDGSMIVRRTTGDYTSSDDQDVYGVYLGEGDDTHPGLNLDPHEFHHFAVTVDTDGVITGMYVDGVHADSFYENGFGVTDEDTGVVGCRIKNGAVDTAVCAYLDDLAVIAGELTETQVQLAMTQGVAALFVSVPGDATGNGVVDDADALILATNWGASGETIGWDQGDFDDDHLVGPKDAAIMAAHWGYGAPSEASAVPEPGTIVLLLTALLAVVAVSRRRA
ncbi:MAG: PEP-CTERM sorting domain-containing protein [Pirellulales bacterium]|nr:PEP-CTERM sorting domain-containing protein [Pirellulales bacterium]